MISCFFSLLTGLIFFGLPDEVNSSPHEDTVLLGLNEQFIESRAGVRSVAFEATVYDQVIDEGVASEKFRKIEASYDYMRGSIRFEEFLPPKDAELYNHLPEILQRRIWCRTNSAATFWSPPNIFSKSENSSTEVVDLQAIKPLDIRLVGLLPATGLWRRIVTFEELSEKWLIGEPWEYFNSVVNEREVTVTLQNVESEIFREIVIDTTKGGLPVRDEYYHQSPETTHRTLLIKASTEWEIQNSIWLPKLTESESYDTDGMGSTATRIEFNWVSVNSDFPDTEFRMDESILPVGTVIANTTNGRPVVDRIVGEDLPSVLEMRKEFHGNYATPKGDWVRKNVVVLNFIVFLMLLGLFAWKMRANR